MTGSRLPVWVRVGIAFVLYVGITVLVVSTLSLLLLRFSPSLPAAGYGARSVALFLAAGALAGILTVLLFARGLGPEAWSRLVGTQDAGGSGLALGKGLLLGMGLASILGLGLALAGGGWREPGEGVIFGRDGLLLLAALLVAAFAEELFFRGYLHTLLRERLTLPWSAGIGGGLFALVHLLNPGASWWAALNIFLAGVLLALLRERSGSLAGPIGWHAGWNMTLGMLYGLPVSGVNLPSLFRVEVSSLPSWVGGGNFGPEGSFPCTVLLFGLLLGSGRKLLTARNGDLVETL